MRSIYKLFGALLVAIAIVAGTAAAPVKPTEAAPIGYEYVAHPEILDNAENIARPASNGNLSPRDNCFIAASIMMDDGRLPGVWAVYDAGYWVTNWTITPGLVYYKCQFFNWTWGLANVGIRDSDWYWGGNGTWGILSMTLHFTFGDRQRFPDYTMNYCAQQNVNSTPGSQCF